MFTAFKTHDYLTIQLLHNVQPIHMFFKNPPTKVVIMLHVYSDM